MKFFIVYKKIIFYMQGECYKISVCYNRDIAYNWQRIAAGKETAPAASETDHVILELKDERNALERFMLHFSHLKKETRKLDDGRFMVKLYYDKEDRTEMLIRILSFGPVVKVTEPESFIDMIRERLEMQRQCSQLFWRDRYWGQWYHQITVKVQTAKRTLWRNGSASGGETGIGCGFESRLGKICTLLY